VGCFELQERDQGFITFQGAFRFLNQAADGF
jgi:hypothetical protein